MTKNEIAKSFSVEFLRCLLLRLLIAELKLYREKLIRFEPRGFLHIHRITLFFP